MELPCATLEQGTSMVATHSQATTELRPMEQTTPLRHSHLELPLLQTPRPLSRAPPTEESAVPPVTILTTGTDTVHPVTQTSTFLQDSALTTSRRHLMVMIPTIDCALAASVTCISSTADLQLWNEVSLHGIPTCQHFLLRARTLELEPSHHGTIPVSMVATTVTRIPLRIVQYMSVSCHSRVRVQMSKAISTVPTTT